MFSVQLTVQNKTEGMLSPSAFQDTPWHGEVPCQLESTLDNKIWDLRFGKKQTFSNSLNIVSMPNCKHKSCDIYLYKALDLPCILFWYLDKCEMEFYSYLKINLESENELEQ